VLKDGQDFSAAQVFTAQHGGDVLAAIVFATNGGDSHPELLIDSTTLSISDLRVRFELGGRDLPVIEIPPAEGLASIHVDLAPSAFTLRTLVAKVDSSTPQWEKSGSPGVQNLDLVLAHYNQPTKFFNGASLRAVVFALNVGDGGIHGAPTSSLSDETLRAAWGSLQLTVPTRAMPLDSLHQMVARSARR
jgi:hypothetical protein